MRKTSTETIYQLQIKRLIEMLEQSGPTQKGLKRTLFDLFGTINHRFRNYYKRQMYVARISKHYRSSNELRALNVDEGIDTLVNRINESDRKNHAQFNPFAYIRVAAVATVYWLYIFFYNCLRIIYRLIRKRGHRV